MLNVKYLNISYLNLNDTKIVKNENIEKFKRISDKKLRYGSRLLLKAMLKEYGINDYTIKRNKYNKPYISNLDNIHFNVSHSKYLTVCAISDNKVGVDIEYIDDRVDLNIAKNFFTKTEYENIIKSENPKIEFYKYWTLKEAYVKYTGKGLYENLKNFQIENNGDFQIKKDLNLNMFKINNYMVSIINKEKIKEIKTINITDLY